jgi:hypothetical protein
MSSSPGVRELQQFMNITEFDLVLSMQILFCINY